MTFSITYTPEEFLKLVGDTTTRSFLRMLPVFSALSLFSGVMFGLLSGIGVGVGAFLLILAVLFLLNVMLPRSRAKRSLETMQQSAMTIRLTLTERGLVGSSARPGRKPASPGYLSSTRWIKRTAWNFITTGCLSGCRNAASRHE